MKPREVTLGVELISRLNLAEIIEKMAFLKLIVLAAAAINAARAGVLYKRQVNLSPGTFPNEVRDC